MYAGKWYDTLNNTMYVYKKDKKYYWGDKEISKFDYHKFIFSICIEPPDGDQWKDIVKNYEGEKTLQQHYPIFYGCPPPGIGSDAFTLDDDGRELCVFLREDSVEYKYVDFNQSVQDICDLCCCFYKTVYLDTEEIDESQIVTKNNYFICIDCPFEVTINFDGDVITHYVEEFKQEDFKGKITHEETDGINIYIDIDPLYKGTMVNAFASSSTDEWWRDRNTVYFYKKSLGYQLKDVKKVSPVVV